ncbi:right-handed parallel beta-helix repeat-containing protein [Natrarchaeobius sp. A-rgal3]|uniref:right-handed parallel beta-helix repeat-containing protein n=1 Tax=Natrarchaeobius versutus TaxID=1679078 RepID=UPI0035101883
MSDETPRFGLGTYEAGDTEWDHTDTVEAVDEFAVGRGSIENRPDEGAYDDELYLATDQRVLWRWDAGDEDWQPATGLGTETDPLPGTAHLESLEATSVNDVVYVDPDGGYDELQSTLDEYGDDPVTVVIRPGVVDDVADNLVVPGNTWLRGSGMFGTTVLKFADDASGDLSNAGLVRIKEDNVVLSDLEVDGNRANVEDTGDEYGFFSSAANNIRIERVWTHHCPGYGFDPHATAGVQTSQLTIRDCISSDNGLDGFTLAGLKNATLENCVGVDNDRHGANLTDVEGEDITVSNCVLARNGGDGLTVQVGVDGVSITGTSINGNANNGIRLGSSTGPAENVTITGNVVRENGEYGANLSRASNVSITDNVFEENVTERGNAEISVQENVDPSGFVSAIGNQLVVGDASFGFDERGGTGPSIVLGNVVRGTYSTAIRSSHDDSEVAANLTS